tara:strand:+ start:2624 stop:3091 length:468 start_codon:yes stop_codon:yes gene_type:complete
MKVIDSKQRKAPQEEVIFTFMENVGVGGLSIKEAGQALVVEMAQPTADVSQFGNTVFLGHRKKKGTQMQGHVMNVDTGENTLQNYLNFAKYLINKGVTHYYAEFKEEYAGGLVPLLKKFKPLMSELGGNVHVAKHKKNPIYGVFLLLPVKKKVTA